MKTILKSLCFCLALSLSYQTYAQTDPLITSWIINTTGNLGYDNIPSDVQEVWYNNNNAFVKVTGVPAYDIGPWNMNPNTVVDQDKTYRLTRNPVEQTGTKIESGLGAIGIWSNGVAIFNAEDGRSYNNDNVWYQNALVFEGVSFDDCLGHPNGMDTYHLHVNPNCLYDDTDMSNHSPLIGYAWDGFPIYGAYAYDNTNGTGAIARMGTSYQLRNITDRTTLPDGTVLNNNQYGPPIDATYPLGSFLEDYEFVMGSGHLDEHNGRFAITPEYPNGIYAYYVTIDENQYPLYPFVIGPTYYGTVATGNTGPNGGSFTLPPPNGTQYFPPALPVDLVSFEAILRGDQSTVYWKTASEKDNAYFMLEKSTDTKNWKDIARLEGSTFSNTEKNYHYVDTDLVGAYNYYRLRQVDINGRAAFSKVVSVFYKIKTEDIRIFNNPVQNNDYIKVYISEWEREKTGTLSLYTISGQALVQQQIVSPTTPMKIRNLASGPYLLKIQYQDIVQNELIIVR